MLVTFLLIGIAVFLSLMLGLSVIRVKRIAVLIHSGIVSAISMAVYWLCLKVSLDFVMPAFFIGLFLLDTIIVQMQYRCRMGNSFISFCISFGSFAMFVPLCRMAQGESVMPSLISGGCFITAFILIYLSFRKRFPGDDWQEYFSSPVQDSNRLNLRKLHIYSISSVLCIINTALLFINDTSMWQTLTLVSVEFVLLWSSVLLIILITYYKKERLTVILEQQYRAETQAFMNVIRSQRHDYNFHVQTIAGLMASNKIDECRAYVKALEKDSIEMNVLMPVKDPAISATIFSFRATAIREGIAMNIDIEYDLSQIATNVYETNKILANLLQNAIDEVSTHSDKSYGICLTIIKRGEFCVIRVSNKVKDIPTAEQLGRIYDQGYTTKKGHEGVGLSSIRMLASKYRGIVYAQTEGDVIHFIARIPINTVKTEEY